MIDCIIITGKENRNEIIFIKWPNMKWNEIQ